MASYEKRGKRVRYSVFVDGKKKNKTFDTHKEGQVWSRRLENRRDEGDTIKLPSRDTLGSVIDDYIAADGRWGTDKTNKLNRLAAGLGHLPLAKLTQTAIVDFAVKLDVARSTRLGHLSYLGAALNHAKFVMRLSVREQDFIDAKGELAQRKLTGASHERSKRADQDEIDLIAGCGGQYNKSIDLGEILQILAVLPIRLGELLKIKWPDINHAKRSVMLRARKHPDRNVKERNNEEIPLLKVKVDGVERDTYEMLVTARKRFDNQDGPFPYTVNQVSNAMRWARKAARVEHDDHAERLRIHDLRAHSITRMLKAKVDPLIVMKISGHKSVKVFFKHYVRLDVEDVRAAVEEKMAA